MYIVEITNTSIDYELYTHYRLKIYFILPDLVSQ